MGKKESDGPKKPLSGYMFFSADIRETIKSENPGRRWKLLTDEEKVPYDEKAAADKARYEAEGGGPRKTTKKSKKNEDGEEDTKEKKPRARTAYILFCTAKREEVKEANPGAAMTEVVRKIADIWRGLSEAEKKPWNDASAREKAALEASS